MADRGHGHHEGDEAAAARRATGTVRPPGTPLEQEHGGSGHVRIIPWGWVLPQVSDAFALG